MKGLLIKAVIILEKNAFINAYKNTGTHLIFSIFSVEYYQRKKREYL